jgi:hypothetical protein
MKQILKSRIAVEAAEFGCKAYEDKRTFPLLVGFLQPPHGAMAISQGAI